MSLRRILAPAPAITLDETRANLRIDHTDEDGLLQRYAAAASTFVEQHTGRAFGLQTWELTTSCFPRTGFVPSWGPVVSVSSITYRDALGAATLLPAEAYQAVPGFGGAILPIGAWPATTGPVMIQYVAGEGWPEDVRQAVHLLVGHWFLQREAVSDRAVSIPFGVDALLGPYHRMYA